MHGNKLQKRFRILLVEDDRERAEILLSWLPKDVIAVTASSAGRAIGILQRDRGSVYAGIMLDHDLQERIVTSDEKDLNGRDVVDVIIKHISKDVPVMVHSMNPSQAPIMVERLETSGFQVTRIPMARLSKEQLSEWISEAREIWNERE